MLSTTFLYLIFFTVIKSTNFCGMVALLYRFFIPDNNYLRIIDNQLLKFVHIA